MTDVIKTELEYGNAYRCKDCLNLICFEGFKHNLETHKVEKPKNPLTINQLKAYAPTCRGCGAELNWESI